MDNNLMDNNWMNTNYSGKLIGYSVFGPVYEQGPPEILCNACRSEANLPKFKYSYKNTCAKHIKSLPKDVIPHVLGKVPDCGCVNCPSRVKSEEKIDDCYTEFTKKGPRA